MLEKGSVSNPSGNLILYCKVIGENPFQAGCNVIASNVVVSFMKINENLPVVTFPPVSFPELTDLQKAIAANSEMYDIARLPDFILPDNKDHVNKYMQDRMEQYNSFVFRYVELCKNKEKSKSVPVLGDSADDFLSQLAETSKEFRSSNGLAKEIAKTRIERISQEMAGRFPQFDVHNFKHAIFAYPGPKGEELARLYLKKFHAIQEEAYEVASEIKIVINDLETRLI